PNSAPNNLTPCGTIDSYGVGIDYNLQVIEGAIGITTVEVTTQDNIPAEITTENGTLQLVATVTPSDVSQAVTWSVEEGTEFVSVDENGLVTAIANGTATVRATSVEDETKYGEIEVVVNISEEPVDPDCEVIETFDVTFDDFENFP